VLERTAPAVDALWWAKRSIGYARQALDRGQVLKLAGLPNDRLLIDLGYIAQIPASAARFPCRVCGAEFVDQGLRDGHGHARHETRAYVPPSPPTRRAGESADMYQNRVDVWAQSAGRAADVADERRAMQEDALAPLDLTKTSASRR